MVRKIASFVCVLGLIFFGYWAVIDYTHLMATTGRLAHQRENMSEREFEYQVSLENAYRINTGFDGTWFLLTLIALIQLNNKRD